MATLFLEKFFLRNFWLKILDFYKRFRTFVIMRLILLIGAFLFTFNTYGQRLIKSPYEARMEARAISNLHLSLDSVIKKERMLTWRPINRVKFTVKTRFNFNTIQKIDIKDGMNNIFSDLDTDDYWSLGSYDIRCKIYATKRLRFLSRIVINGINRETYTYSTGIILKF